MANTFTDYRVIFTGNLELFPISGGGGQWTPELDFVYELDKARLILDMQVRPLENTSLVIHANNKDVRTIELNPLTRLRREIFTPDALVREDLLGKPNTIFAQVRTGRLVIENMVIWYQRQIS